MKRGIGSVPILFPFAPEYFWTEIWQIISEEISGIEKTTESNVPLKPRGMTYKPLFKTGEV